MKITTYYDPTPIPLRCFDWRAYYDPEGPIGYGRTELEALADLAEQTDEHAKSTCENGRSVEGHEQGGLK